MSPFVLRGQQWRLRLELLAGPVAAAPAELRQLGGAADGVPDDLLAAAAATGVAGCAAFLDILDGGAFTPAPCLCCYSVRSPEHMREAGAALRLFQAYYDPAAFVASRAFGRAVATLARDLRPEEAAMVQRRLSRLDATPAAVREVHRLEGGVCLAAPECRPGALWVYSTPDGRRLLRHLARTLKRDGRGALSVTIASSGVAALPRFRFRMYEAALLPRDGAASEALLAIALGWARARRSRRHHHE